MHDKDSIFASPMERVKDFDFDEATASVFDDMLSRSVPFYEEIQHMIVDLAIHCAQDEAVIYDLGCSTGATLLMLATKLKNKHGSGKKVQLIGVDSSRAMLDRARARYELAKLEYPAEWQLRDLNDGLECRSADVFIMNLTLQFVRPLYREKLIAAIYKSLNPGGCFILVEKILADDTLLNRICIEMYYDFKKRKGYSELEVAQKREALENVLIPYRLSEDLEMLKRNGFVHSETFFRWFNFAGFVAIKR